jgi:hypothetical protein
VGAWARLRGRVCARVSMRANMRAVLRVCVRRAGVHGRAGSHAAYAWALVGVSGLEAEGYGDGFGGFDGVAVEGGGLVAPLADGVRGGGH